MNRRKQIHIWIAVAWTLSIIPAYLWWQEALFYVILASAWANAYAAIAAMEAASDSLTENDKRWFTEEITRIIKESK